MPRRLNPYTYVRQRIVFLKTDGKTAGEIVVILSKLMHKLFVGGFSAGVTFIKRRIGARNSAILKAKNVHK